MSLLDRFLCGVIRYLAAYLWLWRFVKRHKSLQTILVAALLVLIFVARHFGMESVFALLFIVIQLLYGFVFMMAQFIGIFWFLAKPKTIEVLPGDPDVTTWDDYWGQKEVVKLVKQWGNLIRDRKRFEGMGGQAVRGLLFIGPPGTGKTHLARCMAGASEVAFYGMDGSGFRAMFWGVDILRVMAFVNKGRKLAKEHGACWLYIDELDALGSRGAMGPNQAGMMGGLLGGRMMGQGALNRLLTEMDGIERIPLYDQCQNDIRRLFGYPPIDQGTVMFVGATNKPDLLDPALLRSGRFDKKIHIGIPDKVSRRAVIKGYLGRIKHDEDIDVEALVQATAGRTPADIKSAFTGDAVRLAYFAGRDKVTQQDLEAAIQEQMLGLQNPIEEMEAEQRKMIAVHEAGHGLVLYLLRDDLDARVVRLSIIRRGDALGYLDSRPTEDLWSFPLRRIEQSIKVSLAGHVAVWVVTGEEWTGASSDFSHVRNRMLALAHSGYFGVFPMETEVWSDKTAYDAAQKRLRQWIDEVKALLEKNRPALDALVVALLEKFDLTGEEVETIIEAALQSKQEERGKKSI